MNRISTIQKRQPLRPDVRPTNVDFYVAKTLYYNGWTTRLDFDIYPSGTNWTVLQYIIKFHNNSMAFQYQFVTPYINGQFRYIYEYGFIQSYKFKITVTAQYLNAYTGEVITKTAPYTYQP